MVHHLLLVVMRTAFSVENSSVGRSSTYQDLTWASVVMNFEKLNLGL
jgi:hypothetical protein